MPALDPSLLNDPALPWRVRVVDEVGSTSDAVREAAMAGEPYFEMSSDMRW